MIQALARLRGATHRALDRVRRLRPADLHPTVVRRRSRRLAGQVRRRWQRSLQLRVVATTMLLGLLVVFALGAFLQVRIRDGLIESREASAMAESAKLTRDTKDRVQASDYRSADKQDEFFTQLTQSLASNDQGRGVVLVRALRASDADGQTDAEGGLRPRYVGVTPSVIPASLRTAVNARYPRQQVQLTSIPDATGGAGTPAIAVGSIINVPLSGDYELYFVYPLEREQQILDLVQQTFLVGGAVLVLLVGGVAYVVTRQVVAPVQQAARTAEELASGQLDRRMPVRGQDDLARLARAFNGMAASLERQIHQLEELSRVQRRFVSDVSHELRTPLTTIRMASEVIHEGREDFDPVLARSAELLHTQLDRFESLLADLLEISRFDAGAAVLEVEAADVREVVIRVVDTLRPLAERRGSRVELMLPTEPAIAQIDARRVERIVRNLVGNAIEHGEGMPIEVEVAGDANAVAVAVRDHGVGINADDLEMVFNRFWRADPARARSTGGTGLGLAIAQEDANLHGGRLQAWGQVGQGATFRLTVPRHAGAELTLSPLPLGPRGERRLGDPVPTGPPTGELAALIEGGPGRADGDGADEGDGGARDAGEPVQPAGTT
ncbi:MtrAB system histidine kinase MtrB [Spongisporangium articulatum]|uniref:Sensor histidine kinase MtrB n=1 Tax=Spongisporangium articulatum TaxID=3362603 RepID=A0ABW8AKY1_9ACTN